MILREFWKAIYPYRWLFFGSIALFATGLIVNIFAPLFYKKFFDLISSGADRSQTLPSLLKIISIIGLMHATNWVFGRAATFMYSKMQTSVMARLLQNSFDYTIFHSRHFFVNTFTGSLVQKINRFSRSFLSLTDILFYNIIPLLVSVSGSILITLFVAPAISAILFVWILVLIIIVSAFSQWKIKYNIAASAADSKTTGLLADSITNQSEIRLFNGYRGESSRFKEVTNDQASKTLKSWNISHINNGIFTFINYSIEFIVFFYGAYLWQKGEITIGTFALIQSYLISIMSQLLGFLSYIYRISEALTDSKEMVEILALPHEIKDVVNAKNLKNVVGKIEFKEVNFSFNETRNVLNNINLEIRAGEKVALIGPSGTGKTTFTGLLLRLFDPACGEILIDGQNIHNVTLESLRANISLVPQDPVLFHRSIMENIRYGKPSATDKEVIAAAKLAHCDEFVETMPEKYETLVGERGIKLSGGERQRVAIARAILKNAPILVLDEATSSLDSQSESLIQDALDKLMAKCTTIAIAHRLSTIRKMDRIIVMDNGTIFEEGTHETLIRKRSGIYKHLWSLQAGGFIK